TGVEITDFGQAHVADGVSWPDGTVVLSLGTGVWRIPTAGAAEALLAPGHGYGRGATIRRSGEDDHELQDADEPVTHVRVETVTPTELRLERELAPAGRVELAGCRSGAVVGVPLTAKDAVRGSILRIDLTSGQALESMAVKALWPRVWCRG